MKTPSKWTRIVAMAFAIWMALSGAGFAADTVWQSADTIRQALGRIERTLYRDNNDSNRARAMTQFELAKDAYDVTLHTSFAELPTGLDDRLNSGFDLLHQAIDDWSGVGVVRARNQIWTALLSGSFELTVSAFEKGDLEAARKWLGIREYARASRDTAASLAIDATLSGRMESDRALQIVEGELLRIYAGEMRRALDEAKKAAQSDYSVQLAGFTARANGLFELLASNFASRMGDGRAAEVTELFQNLSQQELDGRTQEIPATILQLSEALLGYSPVALEAKEQERRARLLHRFLGLVYIEYKDGVRNGRITVAVEYHEARLFHQKAALILGDIQGEMIEAAPEEFAQLTSIINEMGQIIDDKESRSRVRELSDISQKIVLDVFDLEASKGGHEIAFQVLPGVLDEIVMLVGAGDYPGAEMKRLEAYSYFDPDIEQRLVPRAPTSALRLESWFWEGRAEQNGLGKLLADGATVDEMTQAVDEMKILLNKAEGILEIKLGAKGAFLQSLAIIVREGLEAIIVIAALIGALNAAGTVGFKPYLWGGVASALVASFATWLAARYFLTISTLNRELMEGVTALLAAAVLIYVTHWIFQKAYVTDWLSFVKGKVQETVGSGRLWAIASLGFFVVYREGFETVLFYEALMIDASPTAVLGGFAAGVLGVAVFAVAILYLGLKLPLHIFFKATGFLLMFLTIIFVGVGIRGLQTAGMVSATPVPGFPEWPFLQLYVGIFPVAETLIAQGSLIVIFAIGLVWLQTRSHTPSATSNSM